MTPERIIELRKICTTYTTAGRTASQNVLPEALDEIERLQQELALLCPIADLSTIQTLRTELEYVTSGTALRDAEHDIDRLQKRLAAAEEVIEANDWLREVLSFLEWGTGLINSENKLWGWYRGAPKHKELIASFDDARDKKLGALLAWRKAKEESNAR